MKQDVIIVNYGMGNLFSLQRILEQMGYNCLTSNSKEVIYQAKRIILPGVGHFGKAMENLQSMDLLTTLNEVALVRKIPILGICLGMQLMASYSEEGNAKGLNWFNAEVKKIIVRDPSLYKIPHVGWNDLKIMKKDCILNNVEENERFYFVHSYQFISNEFNDILSTTTYEETFVSTIRKNNLFGMQFHPEKSYESGRKILKNFFEENYV